MQLLSDTCLEIQREFASHEAVCGQVLTLFHLASNKTRFRIICMLARGEFAVNEIVEVIQTGTTPAISQQLKALSLAGVVGRRRDGRRILYGLRDERVRELIGFLRSRFLEPEIPT